MDNESIEQEQDRSHLGVITDPTVKIKPGDKLQDFIQSHSNDLSFQIKTYLSIGDIKELYKFVKMKEGVYLNELIQGSDIILPKLEIPTRNPELEKRIQKLKKSLAQKEYDRMTRNVNLTSRYKPEDSIGYQLKQMNSGLIGVFQFVVTVGAAFLFGFMGIEVFASVQFELAVKLLLGIICALTVACAELYFLLRTLDFAETPKEFHPQPQPSSSFTKKLKSS